MTWQEYQEAVAVLYEQLDDIGTVSRNLYIPDKVTGQSRQIDVLVQIEGYGHKLHIVVDAKFRQAKLDVKDIEEVLSLADSVKASQAVIVAANGWTEPARKKAEFANCTLRLLTLEEALDLIVSDKWSMCQNCQKDCVVLDMDGATGYHGGWLWWLAGRCRICKYGFIWCQNCGVNLELPFDTEIVCPCGHAWISDDAGLSVRLDAFPDEDDDLLDELPVI